MEEGATAKKNAGAPLYKLLEGRKQIFSRRPQEEHNPAHTLIAALKAISVPDLHAARH